MDFLDATAAVSAVIRGYPEHAAQARVKPALRGRLTGQVLRLTDGEPCHVTIDAIMDIALLSEFSHGEAA